MADETQESAKAKEERLREKLKRKAEVLKSKDEIPKGSSPLSKSKEDEKEDEKKVNRKKDEKVVASSSSSPTSKSRNDRRDRRRQRPDHQGHPSHFDNRGHGRHGPHGGGGGGGPYRGDPHGRGDWRRDFPPPAYDQHRRNGGHGWHNGNGNGGGHEYNHNRPADGYWVRNARDRFGREAPRDRNSHGRNEMTGTGGSRGDARKERGRSRSRSFSRSRSRSSSYSRSYGSRSSSRSNDSRSSHSRSRSPSSDRSRSRSASRSRSVSRSPSDKRRLSKRSRSSSTHGSEASGKQEREKGRSQSRDEKNDENAVLTKDQRTIFVSQLVMKAQEKDINRYFRKSVGCKVNDVQLIWDKRTGRHKGCSYVELGRLEDVPRAVGVSGKTPDFQRFPILVKASEAEKNYGVDGAAAGEVASTGLTKCIEAQKVYVGSVDRNVTQAQLYAIFSRFGNLDKVVLQVDTTTGMSKGFAFLSYKDPKVANLAIQAMSGQVLAGRPLRTGWANLNTSVPNLEEVSSSEFPGDAVLRIGKVNEIFQRLNTTGLAPLPSLTLIPGMGKVDRNTLAKGLDDIQVGVPTGPPTDTIANAAEEAINAAFAMPTGSSPVSQINGDSTGLTSSAIDQQSPTIETSVAASIPEACSDPKTVTGQPSKNILVRNMFDKEEETEEGWEEDIKLDFEEESSKHDKILSVKVMSKEVGGKIFASFESIDGARACAENLAGRWFDKRQLRVEFVSDETFGAI